MKTVFNNSEICHAWAYASPDEHGRTGNESCWFQGHRLNSYGTQIAQRLGSFVLFADENYSNTTAAHLSRARQAVSHLHALDVKAPQMGSEISRDLTEHYEHLMAKAEDLMASALKRRAPHLFAEDLDAADDCIRAIRYLREIAKTKPGRSFFTFWGRDGRQYKGRGTKPFPTARLAKLQAKGHDIRTGNTEALEEAQRKAAARLARQEAKERAAWAERGTQWKAGEPVSIFGHPDTLVRVRAYTTSEHAFPQPADEGRLMLETSKGVRLPIEAPLVAYKAHKSGRSIVGLSVGGFKVLACNENTVQVGCHKIRWAELDEALAPHA